MVRTCGLGICGCMSGRGHSLTMWPTWPHQKQVRTTPGAQARSTTMASPALVGCSMEGGAGVRASGWARKGGGADARARGGAAGVKWVWGKGGWLVVGRAWSFGVLLCNDSIKVMLLGIEPLN